MGDILESDSSVEMTSIHKRQNCEFDVYEWQQLVKRINLSNRIDKMIFDYLSFEGFYDAATNFCKEAKFQMPEKEKEMLVLRKRVKKLLKYDNFDSAVKTVNETCSNKKTAIFWLKILKMQNFIVKNKNLEAINVAQNEISKFDLIKNVSNLQK
ncbi:hypothetical protein MHBO_000891 [Bonamia ostreae]|uniref:LisH domain-containing protein n=1 Tax=Bonamia ostreae TaxID=126728 RepID=A0ABV2AI13_9EUKA